MINLDANHPAIESEGWYEVEDAITTARTDAAFAKFMAGDNPHLRTDEVPVVDFTSMIEVVGPDGRPVKRSSGRSTAKVALAAVALAAAGIAAALFGLIDLPGIDSPLADTAQSTDVVDPAPTTPADGSGETVVSEPTKPETAPDMLSSTGDELVEQQPLSVDD